MSAPFSWADPDFHKNIHVVPRNETAEEILLGFYLKEREDSLKSVRMWLGALAFSICFWAAIWFMAAL